MQIIMTLYEISNRHLQFESTFRISEYSDNLFSNVPILQTLLFIII